MQTARRTGGPSSFRVSPENVGRASPYAFCMGVSRAALGALLITLAAALPATAGAAPDRVAAAVAIAEQKWGPVCQGATVPVLRADIAALAYAEYRFVLGNDDNRAAYFDCRILFKRGRIPWPKFCTAMVHEYGHLAAWRAPLGGEAVRPDGTVDRKHSINPRKIMFPRYMRPWPRCGKRPKVAAGFDEPVRPRRPASPTVLLLPGGGWQNVDPASLKAWKRDFEAHGYRVEVVAYPTRSVLRAIEFVARRAAERRRHGPVIAYGISAGGTIAAALAATGEVDGAVNVIGPTDFTRWVTPTAFQIKAQLRMSRAEQYAASPYWRLGTRGRVTAQLIQCGVLDPLVTYEQCLRYAGAAKKRNADTTLQPMLNAHAQWTRPDRDRARAWVQQRWPAPIAPLTITHGYR